MAAPTVPFIRTLYPPYASKGPVPGGADVVAVKRAISRAGFWPWRRFDNAYNDKFAKEGIKAFQKSVGLPQSGIYGKTTHDKLRNTRSKGKPSEWAFDPFSINLIKNVIEREKTLTVVDKVREILAFCHKFEGPYIYGGEHDGSFLDDDFKDGFDCSSSTSYVLWKFGLLGSNRPQVSSWFESWGVSGRGKYLTVHANGDHVWVEFDLPEGYFRFDTSPHGDGGRGPRVRTKRRFDSGFAHRHPKGM
jgi:hypothetical protein